jgi:hypothetical protein
MRLRGVAAIWLAAAALAGCGGGEPQQNVGGPDLGVPVRLADCQDWRDATVSERLGTVHELRDFAGGPVGSSKLKHGPVLDDEKAYELLDHECATDYTSAFKLYKLYTRAAALSGLSGQ